MHGIVRNHGDYPVVEPFYVMKFQIFSGIQCYRDYMSLIYSRSDEVVFEEIEQKIRFSASAYSGHHLYHAVVLSRHESVQIPASWNDRDITIGNQCKLTPISEYKSMSASPGHTGFGSIIGLPSSMGRVLDREESTFVLHRVRPGIRMPMFAAPGFRIKRSEIGVS